MLGRSVVAIICRITVFMFGDFQRKWLFLGVAVLRVGSSVTSAQVKFHVCGYLVSGGQGIEQQERQFSNVSWCWR